MSDPNTSNAAASSASSTAATPATSTEPTAQDVAHTEPVPVMTAEETALAAGADPGDNPAHAADVPAAEASAETPAAVAPEPGIYLQVQHEGSEDVVTLELRTDSSQSLKELVADALAAHHPNPGSFLGRAITTLEGIVLSEGLTLLENQIEKGHTIKIVGLPK